MLWENGRNTNVEEIIVSSKLEEEQWGEAILGRGITSCRKKKKEREEGEKTDLIKSDQLFSVAEHFPHWTVIVCVLICVPLVGHKYIIL